LRLSIQPAVVKTACSFADALRALTISLAVREHQFWPLDYPVSEIQSEIRSRLIGHHQLADGLLLDLTIRRSGKFATFDSRVRSLLPADSAHQAAIELL
jgi:predicted nucleic acid-binding protein